MLTRHSEQRTLFFVRQEGVAVLSQVGLVFPNFEHIPQSYVPDLRLANDKITKVLRPKVGYQNSLETI